MYLFCYSLLIWLHRYLHSYLMTSMALVLLLLWIMIDKIWHLFLVTQATDKLKSEEEMAKEEKERLDKLEVIQLADDRIVVKIVDMHGLCRKTWINYCMYACTCTLYIYVKVVKQRQLKNSQRTWWVNCLFRPLVWDVMKYRYNEKVHN